MQEHSYTVQVEFCTVPELLHRLIKWLLHVPRCPCRIWSASTHDLLAQYELGGLVEPAVAFSPSFNEHRFQFSCSIFSLNWY